MTKPWIFQRLTDLVGSSNPYYGSALFDHKVKGKQLKFWAGNLNGQAFQAAIEMVAKVKETLSKSAALKAEREESDDDEDEDELVREKVEKLKRASFFIQNYMQC